MFEKKSEIQTPDCTTIITTRARTSRGTHLATATTRPRSPFLRLQRRRLASEFAHDRRERLRVDPALDERDEHGELFAIETGIEELGDVVRDVEGFPRRVRHPAKRARARGRVREGGVMIMMLSWF